MRLRDLIEGCEVVARSGPLDVEVAELSDDSRDIGRGDLFVAQRGETSDGLDFWRTAVARGAVALLADRPRPEGLGPEIAFVQVADARRALARLAARRFGSPAEALSLIAITGTNGKTTTNFLVEGILRAARARPGLIGTVLYRYGDRILPAPFTTPTPLALHRVLGEMRDAGCTHVTLEASSHALELGRLEGLVFDVAAFTNLTQDHLDFHGTMERYAAAKGRLFAEHLRSPGGVAVIVVDHPHAGRMLEAARGHRVLTVSATAGGHADLVVERVTHSIAGIEAEILWTDEGETRALSLRSPLIGAFNLENLLLAAGIGLALGFSPTEVSAGLASVSGVPGRLERVEGGRGFDVFVDYAHTPDALERVMAALRPLVRGRLIVVFGCGGDRDRSKRPQMGAVAARDAELVLVTSDNPRSEDPSAIIQSIVEGIDTDRCPALDLVGLGGAARGWTVLSDRRAAIAGAISLARPGDVVLIAGKGHEDYQIVGKTRHHFDDREEAKSAIEKMALPRRPSHS